MTNVYRLFIILFLCTIGTTVYSQDSTGVIKQKPIKTKSEKEKEQARKEAEERLKQREGMAQSKAEDEAEMKAEYEKKLKKLKK